VLVLRVAPAVAALAHLHLEQRLAALGLVGKVLLVALVKTVHQTLTFKLAAVAAVAAVLVLREQGVAAVLVVRGH
jgi:hypothetical protein